MKLNSEYINFYYRHYRRKETKAVAEKIHCIQDKSSIGDQIYVNFRVVNDARVQHFKCKFSYTSFCIGWNLWRSSKLPNNYGTGNSADNILRKSKFAVRARFPADSSSSIQKSRENVKLIRII